MTDQTEIRSAKDLGRVVRTLRLRAGMTQDDMADMAGISRDYVAKIESGRSSRILEHELRILRRMGARVSVSFDAIDATQPASHSRA